MSGSPAFYHTLPIPYYTRVRAGEIYGWRPNPDYTYAPVYYDRCTDGYEIGKDRLHRIIFFSGYLRLFYRKHGR